MKIYKPIGSKERFLEMFQGVNKATLNEYDGSMEQTSTDLIEKAFDELRNKTVNIKQTNTQTVNDDNYVEIVTIDQTGKEITFTFKIASDEADQDGVYNVSDGVLTKFKITSPTINVELPENMKAVQEFNAGHGSEIMSVVSEYADFETDTANAEGFGDEDEVYNEAVSLLDKIPYKKGSEEIQTHHDYADNKPTNPKLRVHNDELQKFVSEMEDFIASTKAEDEILATSPEEMMEATDQDRYENVVFMQGEEAEEPLQILSMQGEDAAMEYLKQWHDPGNHMGSDGLGHGSSDQTYEKDGYHMSWNDPLGYIGLEYDLSGMNEVKEPSNPQEFAFQRKYGDSWEKERKGYLDRNTMTDADWEEQDALINGVMGDVDETEKKNDYPDQIGTNFKPKNQMPKKKKKPQSVVKLGEESEVPQEYWANDEELVEGGEPVSDEIIEIKIENYPYFLKRIDSTHFYMGNNIEGLQDGAAMASHINQHNGRTYHDDVRSWLKGGESPNGKSYDSWDTLYEENDVIGDEPDNDQIEGGLADEEPINNFNPEQIIKGMEVEMEHTNDPKIALEIATDHLMEDSEYYTKLENMENGGCDEPHPLADVMDGAESEAIDIETNVPVEDEINVDGEDMTDELLGYKPHNVNDYTNELANVVGNTKDIEFEELAPRQKFRVMSGQWKDVLINVVQPNSPTSIEVDITFPAEMQRNAVNDFFSINDFNYLDLNRVKSEKSDIRQDLARIYELDAVSDTNDDVEYEGEIGDRYKDAENKQYTVRDTEDSEGDITLQGQDGESEISPRDIRYLEKLSEAKVELAKSVLNNRRLDEGMTKKEAVQVLIKNNIK